MHSLRRLPLLFVCSMAACSSQPSNDAGTDTGEAEAEDTGSEEMTDSGSEEMTDAGLEIPSFDCNQDPFTEAFAREVVGTLARPEWRGRRFDEPGLVAATEWTARQFECIGLTPGAPLLTGRDPDTVRQPFRATGTDDDIVGYTYVPGREYSFTNVVGSIPGAGELANEVIVIGAHLDGVGRQAGMDVTLGADDDAAGIAAVLAIARHFMTGPLPENRRTVVFAGWGIEELPFGTRGSEAFVGGLTEEARQRVAYYVNFDLIGHYGDRGKLEVLGAYPAGTDEAGMEFSASAAHSIVEGLADRRGLTLEMDEPGANSDFEPFCQVGIPYVFFLATTDCHHLACDNLESMDFDALPSVIQVGSDVTLALLVEPDLATTRSDFLRGHAAQTDPDTGESWGDCR